MVTWYACAAGESMHWAMASMIGVETGGDYLDAWRGWAVTRSQPSPTPTSSELGETALAQLHERDGTLSLLATNLGRLACARAQREIEELYAWWFHSLLAILLLPARRGEAPVLARGNRSQVNLGELRLAVSALRLDPDRRWNTWSTERVGTKMTAAFSAQRVTRATWMR